jgi:hypothetical protein
MTLAITLFILAVLITLNSFVVSANAVYALDHSDRSLVANIQQHQYQVTC